MFNLFVFWSRFLSLHPKQLEPSNYRYLELCFFQTLKFIDDTIAAPCIVLKTSLICSLLFCPFLGAVTKLPPELTYHISTVRFLVSRLS